MTGVSAAPGISEMLFWTSFLRGMYERGRDAATGPGAGWDYAAGASGAGPVTGLTGVRHDDLDRGDYFGQTAAGFLYCALCGALILEGFQQAHRDRCP